MADQRGVELAGAWPRLAAQLLDTVWMLPLGVVLEFAGETVRGGAELSPGAGLMLHLISALLVLLFWVTWQATPGKRMLRLRIVDAATGETPPWPRLVLRYLGYFVSGLSLGLGLIWMLWDPRRQCWHDKMAGTLVVQDPPRA